MKAHRSQVLFVSLCFALLVGSGFYGFGHDFYSAYHKENLAWGGYLDRLGWALSTMTIYGMHVGVYLLSFLLSLSTWLFLSKTTETYFCRKHYWAFLLLHLIFIHTWPIIMSTSNAMRQGFCMSFLFLALYFLLSRERFYYLVSIILVITTHKSGILWATLLFVANFYFGWIRALNCSLFCKKYISMILGVLLSIFIYFSLSILFDNHEESRIIKGDYRYLFLAINIVYIFIYKLYLFARFDQLDAFLFVCSFVLPVFLLYGFNWEYERLNMIILIPYMVSFSRIFVNRDKRYALLISSLLLLLMTFLSGMYAALK